MVVLGGVPVGSLSVTIHVDDQLYSDFFIPVSPYSLECAYLICTP